MGPSHDEEIVEITNDEKKPIGGIHNFFHIFLNEHRHQ